MLFQTINFFACVIFANRLIYGAKEYEIKKDFMFWARLICFGFLSAGVMNLLLTNTAFYFFAGAAISLFAAYILSGAKISTAEMVGNLSAAMFFWPYFVSYCVVSLAYYDYIVEKLKKEKPLDDGYL